MGLQYVDWVKGVARGDLGKSIVHGSPVLDAVLERLPITLYLGMLAFFIIHNDLINAA